MSKTTWYLAGRWDRKNRAMKEAAALRAPGEGQVRARVVRVLSWQVLYADRKAPAEPTKGGNRAD